MAREPHAGPIGLGELLAASGVDLHDDPAGSGGTCPRCRQPIRVDPDVTGGHVVAGRAGRPSGSRCPKACR